MKCGLNSLCANVLNTEVTADLHVPVPFLNISTDLVIALVRGPAIFANFHWQILFACMYIYVRACKRMSACEYVCVCMHVHMCVCVCVCVCTYVNKKCD